MTSCTVDGCQKRHLARGYCRAHYDQVRKTGTPNSPRPVPRKYSLDDAFGYIAKVFAVEDEGCIDWPWASAVSVYPVINDGHKKIRVHRYICGLRHGSAPFPDAEATHRCGRPCCVNPAHIRWATHSQNMLDRHTHGTVPTKLTDEQVQRARKAKHGELGYLARSWGVSPATLSKARSKRTWKHVA